MSRPYIIEGVGKVLATMFIYIMTLYIFIPKANFKLMQVLLSNIGVGYYDVATPLFVIVMLAEVYVWIVKSKATGP